jgi:hypothetical protein
MNKAFESVVCRDSDAMPVSLQLLAQSDERLYIAPTANNLNDNIQTDAPCSPGGKPTAEFGRFLFMLWYKLHECFGKPGIEVNLNTTIICTKLVHTKLRMPIVRTCGSSITRCRY